MTTNISTQESPYDGVDGDNFNSCMHSAACVRVADIACLPIWSRHVVPTGNDMGRALMCGSCEFFQERMD